MFVDQQLLPLVIALFVFFVGDLEAVSKISSELPVVKLGAIFPIHAHNLNSVCGRLQLEDGVQPLEALLFTLKEINSQNILPGFILDVDFVLDSCDNVVRPLKQFLQTINGKETISINDTSTFPCPSGYKDRVVGIISSHASLQVTNLLENAQIPQINFMSTNTLLNNEDNFSYVYNTAPSDIGQVSVILKILEHFKWTFVSLIHSNTEHGNKSLEEFERLLPSYNICLASIEPIKDNFQSEDYDHVIFSLLRRLRAKVVIIFAEKRFISNLMSAVKRLNAIEQFVWIESDGWIGRHSVVELHEDALEGTIAVQPIWENLTEFFQCRLKQGTNNTFHGKYDECTGNETIAENSNYRQQTYLHFVRDAVYAFAYALKDMHLHLCGANSTYICKEMAEDLYGYRLKKYLDRVQFSDVNGKTFKFQHNRNGPSRYSILNYQSTPNGYIWKEVARYTSTVDGGNLLNMDNELIRFMDGQTTIPKSSCSDPCSNNQEMVYVSTGDKCCWLCLTCSSNQILDVFGKCQDCPNGTISDNFKSCIGKDSIYLDYNWEIVALVVAAFTNLVVMI